MVIQNCKPSTLEAETGALQVCGLPTREREILSPVQRGEECMFIPLKYPNNIS